MTNSVTATLWEGDEQTTPSRTFPVVAHDLAVDALVIGGGITGATAALRLAEAGRRVALVEGRSLCSGVSGATTAHLTELVDPRYVAIAAKFGREGARMVAASTRRAMEHIAHFVETRGVECDLVRLPGYLYAESRHDLEALAREHEASLLAGLPVELDSEVPLPFATVGGLRYPNQMTLHPRRYVSALVRAAVAAGAQVFEHTRIVEIKDGEPVEARTDSGQLVRARAVFCATHSPLNMFLLHSKLGHYQSYVTAYADVPLAPALFWDTASPYHYLRAASIGGREHLVVGGEDHKTGEEHHTELCFDRLTRYAGERFGARRPDYQWSAQVIESVDGLPFIGRNSASKHVYVATGFSGSGMTYGTIAALLVSDLILDLPNPSVELFRATRVKPSAIGAIFAENGGIPLHLVGDRLARAEVRSVDEIGLDEGRIMKVHGHRLAVYRDRQARLHAVSAVCTHMGCVVKFNEAERTWDCPCHGSRFSVEGEVLDGPALLPLPHVPIDQAPVIEEHQPVSTWTPIDVV
jgi:glycine/D-amino acid oxidase-like deaminating enzyme/nitrite reductase/ring-hydroxylating ferredoxin subunit